MQHRKRERGRARSDVSLRHMDAAKPKRSRRDRKKPAPPESLKAREADTLAAVKELPLNPGVCLEPRSDHWQVQSPHSDEELWTIQLAEAFGTRSDSLIRVFLDQLANLCPEDWDADRQSFRVNETEWNAVLALVADWKPENSAQAALAAQMAATHLLTMRLASQALNRGHTVNGHDASLTAKLSRAFATQCETMQLLKGKTRMAKQSIHVTRETQHHVHYHDHRGGVENAHQSDATGAETIEGCSAMPSANESGQVVRLTSR